MAGNCTAVETSRLAVMAATRNFWSLWAARAILVLAFSLSAGMIWGALLDVYRQVPYKADFTVFWTAARFASQGATVIYDPAQITALQAPLIDGELGIRPFAYPPTALFLFGPFGKLPYPAAETIWALASCLAYYYASRRLFPLRYVIVAFFTPPVLFCLISLQVSLITGAGMILGISLLNRRPILAGAVIGMVALVKPSVVVLFPLAALAMKSPKALAGFLVTGLVGVLASLPLGGQMWFSWINGLEEFQSIAKQLGLMKRSVTPNGIVYFLNLPGEAEIYFQLAGMALGAATCWLAFHRDDAGTRLIGLAGGSLLCAPYAMIYELSVLMPALLMMNASQRPHRYLASLPLLGLFGMFTLPLTSILTLVDRRTRAG